MKSNGTNGTFTVHTAARKFLQNGIYTVPVEKHGKRPWNYARAQPLGGWEQLRIAEDAIAQFFDSEGNIGVLLGEPSGGLVDVDLDCPEARRAAPHFLPPTGMLGGRVSDPTAHYFYFVKNPPEHASNKHRDPCTNDRDKNLILEFRSTGAQTVVAPSVYGADPDKGHAEPERFVWKTHGKPAQADLDVLQTAVRSVAAAALLGRYWPRSSRHDAALALAGGLRRAGWLEESAVKFVTATCAAANDEEQNDRIECVRSTFAPDKDDQITGWKSLLQILGERGSVIVDAITGWLGITSWTRQRSESSPVTQERYPPPPPFVPFPTDCLPAPWDAFVREGARALRCDESLIALPLLAVLAGAIGNTRRVHLGAEWFEPAVLWTCPIAESGGMKTSAANLSLDLVRACQKRLVKEHKDAMKEYKQKMKDHQATQEDEPEKPTLKRVVVADVTIEKLTTLHDDNRRGLLVARDELAAWLGSFTKYKGKAGGTDEPNWLSMHRADAIIYDRKTGEKTQVFVPYAATSITGGIQPGVLKRLASNDLFESGLVARIIFAMPPRTPKTWSDDEISASTKESAKQSLGALYELKPDTDDGDLCPVIVKLSAAAKARFKTFVNQWGIRQFEAEGERAAALAKLEALPGRFALIHHTVLTAGTLDDTQPIGLPSLEAGIRLAGWCANEAERVYALLAESTKQTEVRKLVELVTRLADRNGGRVTVNVLHRAHQKKYTTSELAKLDLERLVACGLGTWEKAPKRVTGGKHPDYFILLPRPGVAGDDSYDCPDSGSDDGNPPVGDDRANEPRNGPDPENTHPPASSENSDSYDSKSEQGDEQSYESSPVTQGRETRNRPDEPSVGLRSESHTAAEASVTHHPVSALVTTGAGVAILADALNGWSGAIGLDTETTGLDPLTDRVRLVQIAVGGQVELIDVFALPEPIADLAPLFAALAGKEVVGHNLQFDLRFLARYSFTPGNVFDTMLASRVLYAGNREENNGRLRHGLGDAAERELGHTLDKDLQASNWSGWLTQDQIAYATADAAVLVPLAKVLKAKLTAVNLTATADREMRALPGVAWAEPITVDTAAWLTIAEAGKAEQARLTEEMDCVSPNPAGLPGIEAWNWNSPAQVKKAFAHLGITIESTNDDMLARIDHPLAGMLREYRAASKRVSTYGRSWIEKHVGRDGQVQPSWNQLGAESGRMSCSDPNLQQVPRGFDYRRCVIARPGRVLVKADYSQVELRIAAKFANEQVMIAAYRDGRDLHTLTAARILNKPETEVTKADRQLAKAVNFGLLYGMGWKSLKQYAKATYGVELSDREAVRYRTAFFTTYPAIQKWHAKTETDVRKLFNKNPEGTHEVFTIGGRRRVLPVSKRDSAGNPYPNKTDALNTPVQGTGADGLKEAIALLWERRAMCAGAVPLIFCHDEIVVECDEGRRDKTAAWLRSCMVDAMTPLVYPVPVEVEVSIGYTWGG